MSTSHVYVLHAAVQAGEARHPVHLCGGADDLIENIGVFLDMTGRAQPTTTQIMALAGGPHHPAFEQAMTELELTHSPGCPSAIVNRTIEMMIASETLPPSSESDPVLIPALYATFSTDEDWERFTEGAQMVALTYLDHHGLINSNWNEHTHDERMLVCQVAAAMRVAIIQARAELQRELTGAE